MPWGRCVLRRCGRTLTLCRLVSPCAAYGHVAILVRTPAAGHDVFHKATQSSAPRGGRSEGAEGVLARPEGAQAGAPDLGAKRHNNAQHVTGGGSSCPACARLWFRWAAHKRGSSERQPIVAVAEPTLRSGWNDVGARDRILIATLQDVSPQRASRLRPPIWMSFISLTLATSSSNRSILKT